MLLVGFVYMYNCKHVDLFLVDGPGLLTQGPHSHILMIGVGGGGPSDFCGSEILAKSYFFGSMKDAGIFLGPKKKQRGFFWVVRKD